MPYTIAIHPDHFVHKNGVEQSFSARWKQLAAERSIRVRDVDAYAHDFFRLLEGCDAFMWRLGYYPQSLAFGKRILPAVEHGLGLPVFPSWETVWHFEDKIAQHYLLQAARVPEPATWVFWHRTRALEFCRTARYPLVMKLAPGYQSSNVRLLNDADEAVHWVDQLFGPGRSSLAEEEGPRLRRALWVQKQVVREVLGRRPPPLAPGIQHGYFYVQEFLPGNDFDTRVAVIGDRAFAFRRMNRPNDFRASGSGRIDWDPVEIDIPTVRLAFLVARHLNTQSVAMDGLRRGEERVVGEISYTYASWAVRNCPGHWVLEGLPETGQLRWVEGNLAPEDAIFDDFLDLLDRRRAGCLPADRRTMGWRLGQTARELAR